MKKTIITHFFTTIYFNQLLKILKFGLNPLNFSKFREGKYINLVEKKLLNYLELKNSKIISFYNARSALFHALNIIGLKNTDEVIIQAYTCVSVINAVLQTGAKIKYSDIDETLNLSSIDLKLKINKNTKVIIVQHTFGNPGNILEIKKIAKENNIILIEDCAHSLGAEFDNKKVGIFGDLSIFSFGRDKVISTVNGGFLIINNEKFFSKADNIRNSLIYLPNIEVFKNIMYFFVSYKAKLFYDFFGLGKFIIFISRKLKLIPEVLDKDEKNLRNHKFYFKYPNILAYIGYYEIDKIDFYNDNRIKIAKFYEKKLDKNNYPKTLDNSKNIYLRFLYLSENREKLKKKFLKENILLGNWYDYVIAPYGTDLQKCKYELGICPNAEKYARITLNLPNYNGLNEIYVDKVLEILNN